MQHKARMRKTAAWAKQSQRARHRVQKPLHTWKDGRFKDVEVLEAALAALVVPVAAEARFARLLEGVEVMRSR